MQPKSLEEDLQDGGIRKRRRKRKMVAEDFEPLCLQNASPAARPKPRVLVADTQAPLSPVSVHFFFFPRRSWRDILAKENIFVEGN